LRNLQGLGDLVGFVPLLAANHHFLRFIFLDQQGFGNLAGHVLRPVDCVTCKVLATW
jgi:hypothetical protein